MSTARGNNSTDSSGTATLLTDALGSTIALTDTSAAIQTQYTYEPFGNVTVSGTANANPYQFTGRENDGTGLYYYRARYYSPTFQRFIAQDPIGFGGGDPNLYAYAFGNPLGFHDRLGTDVWLEGPSGSEPGGHLSVNVGDPRGNYDSYSFGVNGDRGLVVRFTKIYLSAGTFFRIFT